MCLLHFKENPTNPQTYRIEVKAIGEILFHVAECFC